MHYRNYRFYIPKTRGNRITNSAKFFPVHCKTPVIEPGDTVRLAAQDLIKALQEKNKLTPFNLTARHTEALCQLANIFEEAAGIDKEIKNNSFPWVMRNNSQQLRVEPSTSHNPTSPRVHSAQARVHQRHTGNNKPIPTIQEEETTPNEPMKNKFQVLQ
jgi:hypothetical protein